MGPESYGSAPLQSLASMPAPVAPSLSALAASSSPVVIRNGGGYSVLSSLSSTRPGESPGINTPRPVPSVQRTQPSPTAPAQPTPSWSVERKDHIDAKAVPTSSASSRASVKRPLMFEDGSGSKYARRGFRLPDEAQYCPVQSEVTY